jgi:diaminohydroxyphosphoribosylaminopyrimidine deaminase / 5-amino-6-(5-phosphoribosylamino)uracil reductase
MSVDLFSPIDAMHMRRALKLARRGLGSTSPNPMVGAVLARGATILGEGWHRRAGHPHAEVEALLDAGKKGARLKGSTLYVTLEPCSTQGRTPPCTEAILGTGIGRVVVAASDPNPKHSGRGLSLLRDAGLQVQSGLLETEARRLNEAFDHWITRGLPFVVAKAAMTLDGRIATASGQSKWITSERARACGMQLRKASDAILVGVNTILHDDPALSFRLPSGGGAAKSSRLRRIVLDSQARTPLAARVIQDDRRGLTTVVVSSLAPARRVAALSRHVQVWTAPVAGDGQLDLPWLLELLGRENVMQLLIEGGGEVHASFLMQRLVQRVAFFYAPMILGDQTARPAVAGAGARAMNETVRLTQVEWRTVPPDLMMTARLDES